MKSTGFLEGDHDIQPAGRPDGKQIHEHVEALNA